MAAKIQLQHVDVPVDLLPDTSGWSETHPDDLRWPSIDPTIANTCVGITDSNLHLDKLHLELRIILVKRKHFTVKHISDERDLWQHRTNLYKTNVLHIKNDNKSHLFICVWWRWIIHHCLRRFRLVISTKERQDVSQEYKSWSDNKNMSFIDQKSKKNDSEWPSCDIMSSTDRLLCVYESGSFFLYSFLSPSVRKKKTIFEKQELDKLIFKHVE